MNTGTRGRFKVGQLMVGNVLVFGIDGPPTDGAAGTGAGFATPTAVALDRATGRIYRNVGTKAAPVWQVVGEQQYTDVTIASADVLALNATPMPLVAAPGANKALIFEGAVVTKPAGVAYAGVAAGEDLAIKYTDASGLEVGEVETTGFVDQTTAQVRYIRPHTAASLISSITPVPNAALVAHLLSGEIITGDQPLKFRVFYRIVPTVL
jgi:hypothetical protein